MATSGVVLSSVCERCGLGPHDGVSLERVNALGGLGRWRCMGGSCAGEREMSMEEKLVRAIEGPPGTSAR